MSAFSTIVFTREQAIDQLVRSKIERVTAVIRQRAASMTNEQIENELDELLYSSLLNAIIEDE